MLFGIVGTLVLAVACVRLVSWFVGFVFGDGSDAVDKKLAVADARRRRYRAQIISLTFRALKSIAMADGHFHESERDCLASCAKALAVKCPNLDEIPTITPRALAKSLVGQEPEKCALIITLMCHFSLIDGEEHPDEFKLVEKFAQEFDVERKTLCARHAPHRSRPLQYFAGCSRARATLICAPGLRVNAVCWQDRAALLRDDQPRAQRGGPAQEQAPRPEPQEQRRAPLQPRLLQDPRAAMSPLSWLPVGTAVSRRARRGERGVIARTHICARAARTQCTSLLGAGEV